MCLDQKFVSGQGIFINAICAQLTGTLWFSLPKWHQKNFNIGAGNLIFMFSDASSLDYAGYTESPSDVHSDIHIMLQETVLLRMKNCLLSRRHALIVMT